MQKVIDFINTHTYDVFIPLTALALLRLGMCRAQLKKTAAIREKKGIYHAVDVSIPARLLSWPVLPRCAFSRRRTSLLAALCGLLLQIQRGCPLFYAIIRPLSRRFTR